ncbi:MAG: collagen binding domain-containing protein [Planctomycetota bacterium]
MRSLLAIVLVAVAGLCVVGWSGAGSVAPPTPEVTGRAADGARGQLTADQLTADQGATGQGRRAHGEASEASAQPPERAPGEGETPGLFGVVLDHEGQPLEAVTVRLLADGARDHQATYACTATDGTFAFADVHGTFACRIWNHVFVEQQVTLAPGERRDVVLQVDEPCVLVSGHVRAGRRAIHDRTVGVHGSDRHGDVHHDAHTDEHGYYCHLLRPGTYEISVVGPPTSMSWSIKGSTIWVEVDTESMARHTLSLRAAPTRVERDFDLPSAQVEVRVRTPDDRPVGDASVTIRRDSGGGRSWTRRTDDDGTITFSELPAGDWVVHGTHEMHLEPMPAHVRTRFGDGRQQVTLTMADAGAALVKLMHEGELYEPLNPADLSLHVAGREVQQGHRGEGRMWVYEGVRFDAVPVGTHELRIEDRKLADGRVRFAPVDPPPPTPVHVTRGRRADVEVPVRRRPQLGISVLGGPEMETSIEVRCPAGTVVPSHRGHDHWRAEVPAGDYTVEVRRGERHRIDRVSVGRADVEHRVTFTH